MSEQGERVQATNHVRVRGETRDICRSLMSKKMLNAKATAMRQPAADATLYASHLTQDPNVSVCIR